MFLALLAVTQAFPTQTWEEDPELSAGFFEGDLDLNEEQQKQLSSPIEERNGLIATAKRWPNNIVHFKITEELGECRNLCVK